MYTFLLICFNVSVFLIVFIIFKYSCQLIPLNIMIDRVFFSLPCVSHIDKSLREAERKTHKRTVLVFPDVNFFCFALPFSSLIKSTSGRRKTTQKNRPLFFLRMPAKRVAKTNDGRRRGRTVLHNTITNRKQLRCQPMTAENAISSGFPPIFFRKQCAGTKHLGVSNSSTNT